MPPTCADTTRRFSKRAHQTQVSICNRFQRNTFFLISHRTSKTAKNDFGHGFCHFFKEMRLNRIYSENQAVATRVLQCLTRICHPQLAKQVFFSAFSDVFGAKKQQFSTADFSNAACGVGQRSTRRLGTHRAVSPGEALYAAVFALSRNDK